MLPPFLFLFFYFPCVWVTFNYIIKNHYCKELFGGNEGEFCDILKKPNEELQKGYKQHKNRPKISQKKSEKRKVKKNKKNFKKSLDKQKALCYNIQVAGKRMGA